MVAEPTSDSSGKWTEGNRKDAINRRAREGTIGTTHSPDLLDLLCFSLLPWHSTCSFLQSHSWCPGKGPPARPPGNLEGLFHIAPESHETPANFYTRAFILPLRFPCLRTLGLTPPDIFAIEAAVRQELLRLPLMATFPPFSSPPYRASKGASPPSVCKVFLDLARPTAPLSFWCWSPPSSVYLLS